MAQYKTARQLRLDERNRLEKPFLDQLSGLRWESIYDEKELSAL